MYNPSTRICPEVGEGGPTPEAEGDIRQYHAVYARRRAIGRLRRIRGPWPGVISGVTGPDITLPVERRSQPGVISGTPSRLVCVRYRYDERHSRRLKTVELIVEEPPWWPEARDLAGEEIVQVQVQWPERELRDAVASAGGRWNPQKRVWEVRYDRIVDLGLEDRIV
jgi:hypothetical protein